MTKIVIVGGGVAGNTLISALLKKREPMEIVLVEPREYFEVPFAQLRVIVDPLSISQSIRKSYKEIFPKGVKHIQSTLKSVKQQSINLENGDNIEFDFLILSTGSCYKHWHILNGNQRSMTERQTAMDEESKIVEKAESFLIIGGGPVGVEAAGEIASMWPEKKISLVQSGPRVLSGFSEKMSIRARRVLETMGVEIITNTRLHHKGKNKWVDENAREYAADYVIPAIGIDVNTGWARDSEGISVDDKGAVKVTRDLRAQGSSSIFVLGDINDVPELKMGVFTVKQANLTIKNLLTIMKNKNAGLVSYKPHQPLGMVPIGRKLGAVQLPFGHPHFLIFIKQKDLFVSRFLK
ncbi:MAG: FAD-dependent oxidoreductase [Spirochaetales bacterium]|nr:FAD-dependent oxidoreductase [Spirochaetales bacterium]